MGYVDDAIEPETSRNIVRSDVLFAAAFAATLLVGIFVLAWAVNGRLHAHVDRQTDYTEALLVRQIGVREESMIDLSQRRRHAITTDGSDSNWTKYITLPVWASFNCCARVCIVHKAMATTRADGRRHNRLGKNGCSCWTRLTGPHGSKKARRPHPHLDGGHTTAEMCSAPIRCQ